MSPDHRRCPCQQHSCSCVHGPQAKGRWKTTGSMSNSAAEPKGQGSSMGCIGGSEPVSCCHEALLASPRASSLHVGPQPCTRVSLQGGHLLWLRKGCGLPAQHSILERFTIAGLYYVLGAWQTFLPGRLASHLGLFGLFLVTSPAQWPGHLFCSFHTAEALWSHPWKPCHQPHSQVPTCLATGPEPSCTLTWALQQVAGEEDAS